MAKTGELCQISGHYKFSGHSDGSRGCHPTSNESDIPMRKGEPFPPIRSCGKDKPRADPIKIHKIDCVWREKYTGSTINTEWHDVSDLDSAEKKASQLSIQYDLEWRYAKCGGKCFSRTFTRK